jgi:hypothetical protein
VGGVEKLNSDFSNLVSRKEFSRENIRILIVTDLIDNPRSSAQEACQFLTEAMQTIFVDLKKITKGLFGDRLIDSQKMVGK